MYFIVVEPEKFKVLHLLRKPLEHFPIETLCVSIRTLPTLRGKSAVFPLAYGAGVRSRVHQSDCHFQWHFALGRKAVIADIPITLFTSFLS